MKKSIVSLATIALLAITGCNSFTDYKPEGATAEEVAFGDSISESIGKSLGQDLNNGFEGLDSLFKTKFNKERILEGIAYALKNSGDTSDYSIRQGIQIGMQLSEELSGYESNGVPVNRAKLFNALSQAFKGDTISASALMELQQETNLLRQRATELGQKKHLEKLENDPKAIENKKAGEAYINSKKAENPDAKVVDGGTVVVTRQEGTGNLITENDTVELIYKGTLIDGTSFDDSMGESRTFAVSGVVPGFKQALLSMKKGGKYTIYIPGDQGYGVEGIPQAGIGPNMALTFDIEVVSINK